MTVERIQWDTPAHERWGHEFRYHLAAGYVLPHDVVVDAACGIGYGTRLMSLIGAADIIGVDIDLSEVAGTVMYSGMQYLSVDLTLGIPVNNFDVLVSFETIEHLSDYTKFIADAKRAKRTIVMSVPNVPTKHLNPYHLHDFAPGELAALIEDDVWELRQCVQQPSELSEICVFGRRS